MIIAGIDYSYTGPSMTIHDGLDFSHNKTDTFFMTSVKKYTLFENEQFSGTLLSENYDTDIERFDQISEHFMNLIREHNVEYVAIEGYAYSAKGKVFHIGENTALLKYKLFKDNIRFMTFAPTEVKKFSGNKGNCGKPEMYDAFFTETAIDLSKMFEYNKSMIDSPIADMVDSYYVCKLLCSTLNEEVKK